MNTFNKFLVILLTQVGSTVVVQDLDAGDDLQFTLVHPHEANVTQGKISIASPIGRAILDRAAGEEIEVDAPAGIQRYRIQRVDTSS